MSPLAENIAKNEQAKHSEIDDRKGIIEQYLDRPLPLDWKKSDLFTRRAFLESTEPGVYERDYVCIAEIWCECLGKNKEDMSRYNTRELNDVMRSLPNWEPMNSTKNFEIYGKQKYYARKLS